MSFSYYEYKYHVSNEQLNYVLSTLSTFYEATDPFSYGVVDSIYYDSLDRRCYHQCLDGEAEKHKFRIRGYGDGSFHQLHQKHKDLYGVGKLKSRIKPLSIHDGLAPNWSQVVANIKKDTVCDEIKTMTLNMGVLLPAIRVKYQRKRFRVNDYRITLDYQVEVSSFVNGLNSIIDYGVLPHHVLEVKTSDPRPVLPFFGLVKLPQISYSKYFLGTNLLLRKEV